MVEIHPRLRLSTIAVPRPLAHVLLFFFFSLSLSLHMYTFSSTTYHDDTRSDGFKTAVTVQHDHDSHSPTFRLDPWHVTFLKKNLRVIPYAFIRTKYHVIFVQNASTKKKNKKIFFLFHFLLFFVQRYIYPPPTSPLIQSDIHKICSPGISCFPFTCHRKSQQTTRY